MGKKGNIIKYCLVIYILAFWTEDSYAYISLFAFGLLFILTLTNFLNLVRKKENIVYRLVTLLYFVFSIDGITGWYLKTFNYNRKLIYKNFITVTITILIFISLIFYGYKDIDITLKRHIHKILLTLTAISIVLFVIFYIIIPKVAKY